MTTYDSLAAEVRQRAKALEDWAISTLGNTAKLSAEAEQALRHHGIKGLRGRAFTLTIGTADVLIILHGRIEGMFISDHGSVCTIILTSANPVYHDSDGLQQAVIVYVKHTPNHVATGWALVSNDFDVTKEIMRENKPVAILTIE